MKIGFKSDPGMVRENNEDFFIIDKDIGLFLVADGLGGHQSGEVASSLCAQTIHSILKEKLCNHQGRNVEAIIKESIDSAHQTVFSHALNYQENEGMGTTVVMALCQKNMLYIAHVGDSRAYIFNSDNMTQITEDHSLVANLVRAGEISVMAAKSHRMKHIISQCVGCDKYVGPDIKSLPFNSGAIFLLCSDGLTDMIDDKDIQKVLKKKRKDLQNCADELVNLANIKGGRDNITLILVRNDEI